MTARAAVLLVVTAAGLALAGIAGAQDVAGLRSVEAASNWRWIAGAAVVTVLFAVSFVSRRRIHAVVGR